MVQHGQIGHRVQNALFLLVFVSTPEKGGGGRQEEGGGYIHDITYSSLIDIVLRV